MNLIVCDENCRHQCEGYCTLDEIRQLTSDLNARCGYFEPGQQKNQDALPEDAYRL